MKKPGCWSRLRSHTTNVRPTFSSVIAHDLSVTEGLSSVLGKDHSYPSTARVTIYLATRYIVTLPGKAVSLPVFHMRSGCTLVEWVPDSRHQRTGT